MSAPYRVGVVIPAGGRGARFGAETPKQYLELEGVPIIARTINVALSLTTVESVVIAVQPYDRQLLRQIVLDHCNDDPRVFLVDGGSERHISVGKGLAHHSLDGVDVILVHDAVRPLASSALFERVADAAHRFGAVIPGVSVTDTLKRVDQYNVVRETIDRSHIRRAQTPQGFSAPLIRDISRSAEQDSVSATDCSALCEWGGQAVHVVDGEEQNIKITTPFDLELAAILLRRTEHADT